MPSFGILRMDCWSWCWGSGLWSVRQGREGCTTGRTREDYLGETNNYELNVQQDEISAATPWGMHFALGRSPGWSFSLAGGWLSGGQVLQAGEGWSAWLEADCLLLAAPGPALPDTSNPSPGQ